MSVVRIALAQIPFPASPAQSVERITAAIGEAAAQGAAIVCFPECYVPGYRGMGHVISPADQNFLDGAWSEAAKAAAAANIAVILGTERVSNGVLRATALVINPDGSYQGFQDKVQVDPSEDDTYAPGTERKLFQVGSLKFGVVICHEGWRYPETVRWAVQRGAHIVFHPHLHEAEPGSYRPTTFGDPQNSFHEKAVLCRAAENFCYFATVNYASEGAPTTAAVANPDGTLLCYQPYSRAGILVADIDLAAATGLLAKRYRLM